MGFVGLSGDFSMSGYTVLDNIFVAEYMPFAPEHCVKVYLYGLFVSCLGGSDANDIESMSRALGLDTAAIRDAYAYWQGCGLVRIASKEPLEVKYLPARSGVSTKKYPAQKYSAFNEAMSGIITGRMLSPNEFYQYYTTMETYNIEPSAMIMIAKYCASIKGSSINYPYILAVARNWAGQDVTTVRAVEDRLKGFEQLEKGIGEVVKALSKKGLPDVEERQLYQKFVEDMGFAQSAILYAAKKCKKGGFARLDKMLTEYYTARITDESEMREYDKNKDELYSLCRTINKLVGVYYEQVDNIVDTYIVPWTSKGFEADALKMIADYCFKSNIRTLEGMNGTVNKLFKQGLVTVDALSNHLNQVSETDGKIREVLELVGLSRAVSSWDRDSYRTWTYLWKLPHSTILEAAKLSQGKSVAYLNRILSDWHANGGEAKPFAPPAARQPTRQYSKDEWAAMLDNIDNIEM